MSVNYDELIRNCADEPIRVPGAIQNCGALLACALGNSDIEYHSDNLSEWIETPEQVVLGNPIQDLIPASVLRELPTHGSITIADLNGRMVEWSRVDSDTHTIYQVEMANTTEDAQHRLASVISRITASNSFTDFCQTLTHCVHDFTGYGHTMCYRFDEDWNGAVIAETNTLKQPNYLGLRFPASDIPPQARALYSENPVRTLADANSSTVRLIGRTEAPLDLSSVGLRAVSPLHIQYLQNMSVAASMSISLMVNGKLFGLIACHHDQPAPLSPSIRNACAVLARQASAWLASLLNQEKQQLIEANRATIQSPFLAARRRQPLSSVIEAHLSDYCAMLGATGALAIVDGRMLHHGKVPDPSFQQHLWNYAEEHVQTDVRAIESLRSVIPEASMHPAASGALFIQGGSGSGCRLVLLREEVSRTVDWAGAQGKSTQTVELEGGIKTLAPRESFEMWREQLEGYGLPWSDNDLTLATALHGSLVEASVAAAAAEASHQQGKAEMSAMILHDLGNALVGINGQVAELRKSIEGSAVETQLKKLHALLESRQPELEQAFPGKSGPMLALVDGLAGTVERQRIAGLDSFNRLMGYVSHAKELVDIQRTYGRRESSGSQRGFHIAQLIQDVFSMLSRQLKNRDAKTETFWDDELPLITADRSRLLQVILNIARNAFESYDERIDNEPLRFSVNAKRDDAGQLLMAFSDNGIGFDPFVSGSLFEQGVSTKQRGSGIGLSGCKRIIDGFGGGLEIHSDGVGKGAVVTIRLPPQVLAEKDNG